MVNPSPLLDRFKHELDGEQFCDHCHQWKPRTGFAKDRDMCLTCRETRDAVRSPSGALGKRWCRGCRQWKPIEVFPPEPGLRCLDCLEAGRGVKQPAAMTRWCRTCRQRKPHDAFVKGQQTCIACTQVQRQSLQQKQADKLTKRTKRTKTTRWCQTCHQWKPYGAFVWGKRSCTECVQAERRRLQQRQADKLAHRMEMTAQRTQQREAAQAKARENRKARQLQKKGAQK